MSVRLVAALMAAVLLAPSIVPAQPVRSVPRFVDETEGAGLVSRFACELSSRGALRLSADHFTGA